VRRLAPEPCFTARKSHWPRKPSRQASARPRRRKSFSRRPRRRGHVAPSARRRRPERLEGQARSLRAGTRGSIRTPAHAFLDFTYSCQTGAEHFQRCAEFLPLRNRGFGPLAVTVLPIPLASVLADPLSSQEITTNSGLRHAGGFLTLWCLRLPFSFAAACGDGF